MKKYQGNQLKPVQGLPFKLATTSFIYPDRIIPNVRKLGPVFDEIELLIFESRPFVLNGEAVEVLPSADEIRELADISHSLDVTYNIHLPVDISMTDMSEAARETAVDTVKRVVELCHPLQPTTHTLHLELCKKDGPLDGHGDKIRKWRDRARKSLEHLTTFLSDPSMISIETLSYPFELLDGIIDSCGMSVCVDAGHLIKYDFCIDTIFEKYRGKIPLIHLHGVEFPHTTSLPALTAGGEKDPLPPTFAGAESPKDHQSLDKTPLHRLAPTLYILREFKGVVSLEVFSHEDLYASLQFLNSLEVINYPS